MGIFSCHYLLKKKKTSCRSCSPAEEDICLGASMTDTTRAERLWRAVPRPCTRRSTLPPTQSHHGQVPGKISGQDAGGGLRAAACSTYKPRDTPVVEIAGDGKTARGIWTCRNSCSRPSPLGSCDPLRNGAGWRQTLSKRTPAGDLASADRQRRSCPGRPAVQSVGTALSSGGGLCSHRSIFRCRSPMSKPAVRPLRTLQTVPGPRRRKCRSPMRHSTRPIATTVSKEGTICVTK